MTQQDGAGGVTTVAKGQASEVGRTAADAGGQVAQTTKEQAQNVVGEAKQQARDLVGEARSQVREQAGSQKGRAVEQLRTLGDELHGMADQGGQSGLATEVARQVAQRTHGLADFLDSREPADLLEDVRAYARRRPVAFLAGAALAGVLAGRLTRSLASKDDGGSGGRHELGAVDTGYAPALATSYPAGTDYGTPVGGYAESGAGYAQGTGYTEGSGYAQGTGYTGTAPAYTDPTPGYTDPTPGYADPTPGYTQPGYPADRPAQGYGQTDPEWRTP